MTEPTEEQKRLYFLMGAVEELTEVTKQQQEIINALIEQSITNGENLGESIQTLDNKAIATYDKMRIDFMEKTDLLPQVVADSVNNNIKGVLESTSAKVLDEKLGETLTKYDEKIKKSTGKLITSITEANGIAEDSIKNLQKWLGWKVIALWFGSVFITFMSFALIVYFYVPSMSEIAERRAEYQRYSNAIAAVERANQPKNTGQDNLNPFTK